MRFGWVAMLVVFVGVPVVRAEEVVETFEDGKPRLRYGKDAEGRKHGTYVELSQDGKVVLRCNYREDRLDGLWTAWYANGKQRAKGIYRLGGRQGKWEEWKEDGSLWRTSTWRDDRRDGATQVLEGKEVVADQAWQAGRLVRLDGTPAFVRTVDALEALLAPLHPEPLAEDAPYDLAQDRARALRLLHAYRCLCEVPYLDVVADPEAQVLAQEASRICAALGRITHDPPNDLGWPKAEYERAFQGAHGSNLHSGGGATYSVDGYMDDSDPKNVVHVGHRCWCLDPNLVKTGFGVTIDAKGKGFTAMWATDGSRTPALAPDLVAYPPRGWCPLDMFGPRHAWSAVLGGKLHAGLEPARLTVEVQPLDAEALPVGAPLALEDVRVADEALPGGERVVIFRPKDITLRAGDTYRVTIGGFGPATKKGQPPPRVRYVVGFYASPRPPKR